MHVAVVTQMIPNPAFSGHMLFHWSIIQRLRRSGHKVTSLAIVSRGAKDWMSLPQRAEALRSLGVDLIEIPLPPPDTASSAQGIRNLVRGMYDSFERAFPTRAAASPVQTMLRDLQPDIVLAGSYEGLAAVYGFDQAPLVTLFGDPFHLAIFYRWWCTKDQLSLWQNVKSGVGVLRLYLAQVPRLSRMMRSCAALGATAAHHARWYARKAGRPCLYLPSVAEDRVGPAWRQQRESRPPNRPPRIVAIGHLGRTVTIPGIKLFVREVLPVLDQQCGPDGVEVHFIGSTAGAPKELLELAARRPTIQLRGFVDPIDPELLSADVVLALTPIPLGNRLGIATAFSFGCCVVSHRANQYGMPALRHEDNVLLADNGNELARQVIRALRDESLRRRLGENARTTYEQEYSQTICEKVEELLFEAADHTPRGGVERVTTNGAVHPRP